MRAYPESVDVLDEEYERIPHTYGSVQDQGNGGDGKTQDDAVNGLSPRQAQGDDRSGRHPTYVFDISFDGALVL